ncbi:MAG: leucine-rich repeat domain-containing protein [Bacteroidales bacterium]|nr:leucine-rich repeat domain-containing protein [Bacteroidales bacterium]
MRKILSAIALLLATIAAQATGVRTSVDLPLEGGTVATKVVLNTDTHTASIGWDYDACIPQYSVGKLNIPSTITYNGDTYTVTAIANVAFRFCTQLTEVEIEEGVTTIGNYAFIGCSNLEAISLPSTLTNIGGGAFCGLSKLTAIKVCATTPPTWAWYDVLQVSGGTEGVNSNLKLYVPDGCQNDYLSAKWDYSWTCMNTNNVPYTWDLTETRSQVGWGSYFNENTICTLEQWNQRLSINIFSVADLKAFRDMVNAGTTYKDYIITLETDLDLNNEEWTPIGRVAQSPSSLYYDFCGTFDGKGHTIKNLKVSRGSGESHNRGLFGGTRNATIKRLIVEDASVAGDFYVGTVVGHAEGTTIIQDTYVKNSTVSGRSFTGGIVGGAVNYDNVDNCDLQMDRCVIEGGSVSSFYNYYKPDITNNQPFWESLPFFGTVGGLIGYVDRAKVQNCANLNTKVFWDSSWVYDEYGEELRKTVTRGALIGYQQNNAATPPALSNCYVLLHPDNSLTASDYLVSAHKDYLDPDRYFGNAYYSGGVTHWSYNLNTLAKSGEENELNGLQLQSTLGTTAWGYTDEQLPLPASFAYLFGNIPVNKAAFLPYGTEIDAPNYLTLTEDSTAYTANSIYVNENFAGLNNCLPLGSKQITVANGIVNDITLSATLDGTQQVTTEYPVYVKDENNMLVLDPHGNPVQATNDDGTPMTESFTETVNTYTPKGYTLYLPYSITLSGDCKVYEPTSWDVSTSKLNFTRVENNEVEAYKPYYVVVNKGEISLNTYTEHVIATQPNHTVTLDDGSFKITGALHRDLFFTSNYYILNNSQWVKTSLGSMLDAFTFYIQSNQANPGESFGINLIDNTVIDLAVTGHGESNGGWAFIASPVVNDIAPSVVENLEGVKYETGTYNYDLYRFNQSADLEWENYHSHDTQENPFMLENGKGYLYASKNDRTLHFSGPFNIDHTKTVNLEYDANAEFAGWNLVGNPFPVAAYANRSYYKMNAAGTAIDPVAVSSATPIDACTGVMVKAETTGETVTFSRTAQQGTGNNRTIQIAVAQADTRGNAIQDKAIVSFNAGDRLEKFVFGQTDAKIYIPQDGKDYAVATVGGRDGVHIVSTEVPLHFKAAKNGTYTLTFDTQNLDLDYLHLIDNLTGADVDLLSAGDCGSESAMTTESVSYTFTAKTTDYASRFRLVFSEPADETSANRPFAFISNGNIVINETDARGASLQVVDVMGRVVVSTGGHTRCVPTAGMTPGVYVLRLIDGTDVRTQKIVID